MANDCGVIDFREDCEATPACGTTPCPPDLPDECAVTSYVDEARIRIEMDGQDEKDIRKALLWATEFSRLFDTETLAPYSGWYRTAKHTATSRIFEARGERSLTIDPHVRGSVESVWIDGQQIAPSAWGIKGDSPQTSWLVYAPCQFLTCQCSSYSPCAKRFSAPMPGWNGCVMVCARWGWDCTPQDIQIAILTAIHARKSLFIDRLRGTTAVTEGQYPTSSPGSLWKSIVERYRYQNQRTFARQWAIA